MECGEKTTQMVMVDGTRAAARKMDGEQVVVGKVDGETPLQGKPWKEAALETRTRTQILQRLFKILCLHLKLLCRAGNHRVKLATHLTIHLYPSLCHPHLPLPQTCLKQWAMAIPEQVILVTVPIHGTITSQLDSHGCKQIRLSSHRLLHTLRRHPPLPWLEEQRAEVKRYQQPKLEATSEDRTIGEYRKTRWIPKRPRMRQLTLHQMEAMTPEVEVRGNRSALGQTQRPQITGVSTQGAQ